MPAFRAGRTALAARRGGRFGQSLPPWRCLQTWGQARAGQQRGTQQRSGKLETRTSIRCRELNNEAPEQAGLPSGALGRLVHIQVAEEQACVQCKASMSAS